jgi:PAS domain-containing protein
LIAYRKDGALVWVELIIVAPRCAQGEITGYLGIHRDITERKRAEEALSAAQRGSKTILESMSDDFFALDREWRYTYVNERALATARRAVGRDITRPELFGMPVWELVPQLVGTTIYHEFHRAMREQRVAEFEATPRQPGIGWRSASIRPSAG